MPFFTTFPYTSLPQHNTAQYSVVESSIVVLLVELSILVERRILGRAECSWDFGKTGSSQFSFPYEDFPDFHEGIRELL